MADLIFNAIGSLDGYVVDAEGNFQWAAPDDEVHAHVNDISRPIGTYLLGRRMYEVLTYWDDPTDSTSEVELDYAGIWQATDKVVYSTTLEQTTTARTRLERAFDPAAVRAMKETATADLSVGGPTLAAEALRAGLVDEIQLYLHPVVVGGGTRALPDGLHLDLALVDERRFKSGVTFLRYRTTPS